MRPAAALPLTTHLLLPARPPPPPRRRVFKLQESKVWIRKRSSLKSLGAR